MDPGKQRYAVASAVTWPFFNLVMVCIQHHTDDGAYARIADWKKVVARSQSDWTRVVLDVGG